MNTLRVNGKKICCPACYEELKTGTFQRVFREWDPEEPDISKRDGFKLFSILSDSDFAGMERTLENEAAIWQATGWFITQPFRFSAELPKVLQIGEKRITVPKKVSLLTFGQNINLRQAITESKYMEENISMAVAICLQPLYDESKYDFDSEKELEKLIL
mgnify:CR=1 FL=1